MDTVVKYDNIFQYNESRGVETLHPLVSVIDFSKCGPARFERQVYGFYTIFLKEVKCGDLRYGRNYYDYQEGTLVFLAPGQVIGYENNGQTYQPKGWALLFHPDLLRGTHDRVTEMDFTIPAVRGYAEKIKASGFDGVLINITGSNELGLDDVETAANIVMEAANPEANIIFGAAFDDTFEDEMRVTVIATGFDDKKQAQQQPANKIGAYSAASEKAKPLPTEDIDDIDEIFKIFNKD